MELMSRYEDNHFDLAIVDPPYQDTFKIVANSNSAKVKKNYNLDLLNGAPKDIYWNELKRVSKNQIIWGVNHYNKIFGKGRIVWIKIIQVFILIANLLIIHFQMLQESLNGDGTECYSKI